MIFIVPMEAQLKKKKNSEESDILKEKPIKTRLLRIPSNFNSISSNNRKNSFIKLQIAMTTKIDQIPS